jgi:aminopeptidase N
LIPADDPFWTVIIGDPGPDLLFDNAVYYRGAMTLQALRLEIGDENFFQLIRTWAEQQAGDTVFTPEFIALAEQISGQELDDFFETWLYTPAKPEIGDVALAARATASTGIAAKLALRTNRR